MPASSWRFPSPPACSYELGLVLTMTREKGETAQQWSQRMDQGRTVVGRKLGGNNLSDSCYVEMLLRDMEHSEKGEMIKAQVLRHATAPYEEGTRVMVTADNKAYRAKIIRLRNLGGMLSTVDVEYDPNDAFDNNVEEYVALHRLTLDHNSNTHAKAMESIRLPK